MFKSILSSCPVVAMLLAGAGQLSAQTVPPAEAEQEKQLISVLESEATQKEKADACRQLAVVGTQQAVPALAALLGDEKLSHMARYGLEPIPDASVDSALREALAKVKGRLLVGVIGSLGVRRDTQAVPALAGLLADSDPLVASAAARALGKIGGSEAARVLTQALATLPAAVRPAVADGCLACAEALLAEGKRSESASIYEKVGGADLPKHFRLAAAQGAILARQADAAP